MIKPNYDPGEPYRYVRYARMSSDQQNDRSPQQQFDAIDRVLRELAYPWVHVRDYCDEAISGRYNAKRPQFQAMLKDVRSGKLEIDLILVHTYDRLGRNEELGTIISKLERKHGVYFLTADQRFQDPTSPHRHILKALDNFRAVDENRVKAEHVLRGKRDAVAQKKWAGGRPPFGYRLESVLRERNGRQDVDHCILVPDLEEATIIKALFSAAHVHGFGATRLAWWANENPDIPERYKPFTAATVGRWLQSPVYVGEYHWGKVSTAVIDDARVVQRNEATDVVRIDGFCEPLVERHVWQAVNELRARRAEACKRRKTADKLLRPLNPGLALKYPLSGLVRCGHCLRSMTPGGTGAFKAKSGDERRYVAYLCPAARTCCDNRRRIPEEWLRTVVVNKLRDRLLGARTKEELAKAGWFPELRANIEAELTRMRAKSGDDAKDLRAELGRIDKRVEGWTLSLAKPDLSSEIRSLLESCVADALAQKQVIEGKVDQAGANIPEKHAAIDVDFVFERLQRLSSLLAFHNASEANVELAAHIDSITCFADGRVVTKICKLGALSGIRELLPRSEAALASPATESAVHVGKPRRRSLRRVEDHDAALAAAEVDRFRGLSDEWFWVDTFHLPERIPWSDSHALEVLRLRVEQKLSIAKLAQHFGKCKPTIQKALRKAAKKLNLNGQEPA